MGQFRAGQFVVVKGIVRGVNIHPTEGVYVDVETASGDGLMSSIHDVDVIDLESLVSPEKKDLVIIPQYVADWITYCKFTGISLLRAFRLDEFDLFNYAKQKEADQIKKFLESDENIEVFALAYIEGYEVEKEQLYWVRNNRGKSLLYKSDNGNVSTSIGNDHLVQEENIHNFTFTEKEIKGYDERYWAFAIPVEEEQQ